MRKLVAFITALIFTISIAALADPETIDLEEMTADRLTDLIKRAATEMEKFNYAPVLFDRDGITITYDGAGYTKFGLGIGLIIENNRQDDILMATDNVSIDGEEYMAILYAYVESGHMAQATINVIHDDMSSLDNDLKNIEIFFVIIGPYESGYKEVYKINEESLSLGVG